jgi:hypothetical protein
MNYKITWSDIKTTCSSLDNAFSGGLIISSIMLLYWIYQVIGIYLFTIPIGYMLTCYLGKAVKPLLEPYMYKKIKEESNES